MKKILLALLSFVVVVSVASAQDSLRMHDRVSKNKELYKDLNLSKEQKEKIQAIRKETKAQREAIINNKSLPKENQKKQLQQLRESNNNNINAVLTPEQQAKFKNIQKQNTAFAHQRKKDIAKNKELYKGLNLSDEQKTKMKSIKDDAKTKRDVIVNNKSLTAEEQKKQLQELRTSTQSNMKDILTAEQKKQLKENREQMKSQKSVDPS